MLVRDGIGDAVIDVAVHVMFPAGAPSDDHVASTTACKYPGVSALITGAKGVFTVATVDQVPCIKGTLPMSAFQAAHVRAYTTDMDTPEI